MSLDRVLPEFYQHIWYVVYNGPPTTLTEKCRVPRDPSQIRDYHIQDVIRKCGVGCYPWIINPSEDVIVEAIRRNKSIIQNIRPNASKRILRACIEKDHTVFPRFQNQFSPDELNDLLNRVPILVTYLAEPSYQTYERAINRHYEILQNQKSRYCSDICRNEWCCQEEKNAPDSVNFNYGRNMYFHKRPWCNMGHFNQDERTTLHHLIIKDFPYRLTDISGDELSQSLCQYVWNLNWQVYDRLPDQFKTLEMSRFMFEQNPLYFRNIPDKFKDQTWCVEAFGRNYSLITYIPPEYRTGQMLEILYTKNDGYRYYKLFSSVDQSVCDALIKANIANIAHIPPSNQTIAMCQDAVTSHPHFLLYCHHVTCDMMNIIFKHPKFASTPRATRYDFIQSYPESQLLKIVSVKPDLIRVLGHRLTDAVIRRALETDGYVIQYVPDKKPEYVQLALASQPKCCKYIPAELMV